jgi:uncharacterized protein (TIGR02594 family)
VSNPRWLTHARQFVGVQEIPGKTTAPVIGRWLRQLNAWWTDDETPWCGAFVGGCLTDIGLAKPKDWYRARAYLNYGYALPKPQPGCIVVFNGGLKRPGGGHVGFVVGQDQWNRLMVLGGNQGNAVTIAPFVKSRVLGYRWPLDAQPPKTNGLPLLADNGQPASDNEA